MAETSLSSPETRERRNAPRSEGLRRIWRKVVWNWQLYVIISPVLAYFIIFEYIPMYGVQIAFKDFIANKGIWGSPWVGFKHLEMFFDSFYFERLLKNTIFISLYTLIISFPVPIVLALIIHELSGKTFKRFVQTVTYAPHFLSMVVLVGMMFIFLHPERGIVNHLIGLFGIGPIAYMEEPGWFKTLYVFSGVWQGMGFASIIYLAALAGVDPQLHEAAKVDGASRMRRIWHINIPGIMSTAVIILILSVGGLLSVGFEKIFLMQNENFIMLETSEVISTYVYKQGIQGAQYSFAAAVGLFNSVINFTLLVLVNAFARRVNETSLW
ncbi:ABC transporter permease subunit [Paenibacillus sp. J5C_2022]|uniref:ABC transporter permease n=1 Tax=Paenibacillus sp. J5C2022 TaxID=2977129 RepID=UPI0021D2FEBF|nr:ABC transporter permease subunit [Paenibacillus sp. J5C2022]MCU6708382.1 ABC transporter permease subunit [Paenibacillus sp. J5C2022]